MIHLFKRNNSIKLKPVNELEAVGGHWLSTGQDPYFYLDKITFDKGWYRLNIHLESAVGFQTSRLYFDYGQGFQEPESIALGFESNEPTSRLFYLDRVPKRVRFDPLSSPGIFTLHVFEIRSQPEGAVDQAIKRLATSHSKFMSKTIESVKEELYSHPAESLAQMIHKLYDSTFQVQATPNTSYKTWIEAIEKRTSFLIEERVTQGFEDQPKVSVLVPVYNAPEQFLVEMIESVLEQSYPNWELCLVDDASTDPNVKRILNNYSKASKKVKFISRKKNGHISKASNDALELATGRFIALLDHDDRLHRHALAHFVESYNEYPTGRLFYSDEDKINSKGERYEPHFKSGWNQDLLYSQNYISHLGIYERELVLAAGGFREGYEGSQDHDLVLRCIEHLNDTEIIHIPRVLYHWRAIEGSTALASNQKNYTEIASMKALEDHFQRINQRVEVSAGLLPNTYRCHWVIPKPLPLVSLLIPTRDRVELLHQCVKSILEKTTYQNFEILILNNQSRETKTLKYFQEITKSEDNVRVVDYNYAFNYSAINNYGALFAKGSILGLINNDIEVISPDWLTEMVSHAVRSEIGCVGAKLYFENDTIQHAGVITGIGGVAGHSHKYFDRSAPGYFGRLNLIQNYSAVTAAALLVRHDVFLEVGGLRESLTVAFNDVDFCLKVRRAGYRNLWTPYAELYHYESISRGTDESGAKKIRFDQEIEQMVRLWSGVLDDDPFYNRNLTKIYENFELHVP